VFVYTSPWLLPSDKDICWHGDLSIILLEERLSTHKLLNWSLTLLVLRHNIVCLEINIFVG